jgi:cytosine deaminase
MTVDLLVQNVTLEGWSRPADISVRDGIVEAIEEAGPGPFEAIETIDGAGMMATPPFVDAHQHLDCAHLSEFVNHTGTLSEAIEINARITPGRATEEVAAKATRALEEALLHGTGWMRSHVNIDSAGGLAMLHPVVKAAAGFRGRVDVQVVAFPQLGFVADPQSVSLVEAALREGADVVGGIPAIEASAADSLTHIETALRIAAEFDADVDMHIDESDYPGARTLEILAEATVRHGYQGRVTAGHCTALAAYDDAYAAEVIAKVAEAQINVVTNPMTNLYLGGRGDSQPVRRGITRVKELLAAGVNVACGLDDVDNLFLPFGRMDMLEVAMITALTAHMSTPEEIETAFDLPRSHGAEALRLEGYGIEVGTPADFVLLEAADAREALRLQPPRRYVVRNGRVVATTSVERHTRL